ncbi:hypothetical protein B0H14DRAFT_2619471 [Mycena olivaceomarginata]|nr:hypothetical protein B0H14DRAFT_2619471 [Mycena olivaceomarginata]
MTNRALPRQLLQHEFYVHFISTSQHASIPEQFKEFQKLIKETEVDPIRVPDKTSSTGHSCYRIIVNADPSDNPMQAEICSCMGGTANYPCRKCKGGGNQQDEATDEGYRAMFSVNFGFKSGEPRSKEDILGTVEHQIELACEGDETDLKKTYKASGIKDKYTEYWISDILSQFKKAPVFDHGRCFEISLAPDQKKLFELRLQATNTAGLSIKGIRAGYIIQYANSLIGQQFKIVLQSTVFQIYDLVDENHFRAWEAVGDLEALL